MGTKNNPGAYDCYAAAEPDEPIFTLRASDERAPGTIRTWVNVRRRQRALQQGSKGLAPLDEKDIEALACADEMETWQQNHLGSATYSE